MDGNSITFDEIKRLYADEWVLLGNPLSQNTSIVRGVVLYRSKDKKEVCYVGKDKTDGFDRVTIAFAGDIKQNRRIGILKRI